MPAFPFQFSQKANMHRHRGTHSGVKPYECRFCQKKFFRKDQVIKSIMNSFSSDFLPIYRCKNIP